MLALAAGGVRVVEIAAEGGAYAVNIRQLPLILAATEPLGSI